MRKAAEALDDLEIGAPVTAQRTTAIGMARQGSKQAARAALVGEVFAVVIRHIEEPAPHRTDELVEAPVDRPVGCGGARQQVELALTTKERLGIQNSARVLREIIDQVEERLGGAATAPAFLKAKQRTIPRSAWTAARS